MQSNPTMFKAGIIIIMVFIIGFFTGIGALGTFLYIKGPPVPFFKAEDGFRHPPKPRLRLDKMVKDLDLSEEQRVKIEQILRQARAGMRDLRKRMKPELESMFEQTRQEIRALLDAAQQEKFDKNVAKMKRRFERFRKKVERDEDDKIKD